tara:strand:+ start:57 stop:1667 length:1611 start_codon:yes stop_codon:yes gene_type:complete
MGQATQQIDMPAGGIGDFIFTDEEIKLLEKKEVEDQYGTEGIATFNDIGRKMANYGRYGDDTVAHVETGELIVPRALIENNPKLKESIFSHLRELGVEDPERYVVGTSKNSINPDTGLPEFFLKKLFRGIKKGVSSIGKGVSRALKGVGKALKKAAPIVLPVALNFLFPGLGAVYSGAIGSGIATLAQGGSLSDAFRSALVGGATGAVAAGLAGPGEGLSGFGQNIAADVSTGTSNIGSAFQGDFSGLQGRTLPSIRDLGGSTTDTVRADTVRGDAVKFDKVGIEKLDPIGGSDVSVGSDLYGEYDPLVPKKPTTFDTLSKNIQTGASKVSDFAFGKSPTQLSINQRAAELVKDFPGLYGPQVAGGNKLALAAAEKELAPKLLGSTFLRKAAVPTAVGIAALSGAGAFDVPEEPPLVKPESGLDVYSRNPELYNIANFRPRFSTANYTVPSNFQFDYTPYQIGLAEGGDVFPRRTGGIGPNEGTPGKDSVRAMLMPGEFVMTTDAVRGLGNGNLNTGIKNMYSVMSKLEKKGKAMA